MIHLKEVSRCYRGRNFQVDALRGVNLEIPSDQYLSVIGKSGSGKSTLLKILGLLDFDYEGIYTFLDQNLRDASDSVVSKARRNIGYVFQDFRLIARYTIKRNLEIASTIRMGSCDTEVIEHFLEEVGLADKAYSYPDELSGGQKQRAAIARAVLCSPELVIADEPTGALDRHTSDLILDLMSRLHDELKCTIIVVTHDMEVASRAARTIELIDGEVVNEIFY